MLNGLKAAGITEVVESASHDLLKITRPYILHVQEKSRSLKGKLMDT